jgi:uncharacterized protein (DUF885 family)
VDALAREAKSIVYDASPCRGTMDGLHEHDTELPRYAPGDIDTTVTRWKTLLTRVEALDTVPLSLEQQVDRDVLRGVAQNALFELSVRQAWRHNPMLYIQSAGDCVDALLKRSFAPAPERVRRAVERLKGIPALLAQGKANVTDVPPVFAELALREAKGSVGFFQDTVATWAHEAVAGDPVLGKAFDDANARALTAVKDYAAWLEKDVTPHAHGSFALGRALFQQKLKVAEGIDEPLDKLLARGEAQLQKDHDAFVATARRIDATRTPAEVMESLGRNHPTAEGLLPSVASTLKLARDYVVAHGIVTVPADHMPEVRETPPYLRAGTYASMDAPGPYETRAREAFYYVTPVEPSWPAAQKEGHLRLFNPPLVQVITLHEVFPGHYLQTLYSQQVPTPAQKLGEASTNIEGWAHYGEQMMLEQGFGGGDPKVQLAQLSEALLRDCRYVASIKLHTEGWTVEQAAKLMTERCFQIPEVSLEEAKRGTYDAIYLYYTYGKLEIQDLAREYLAQGRGTLRDFHDAFVRQGQIPVPLIRKLILR